MGRNRYGVQVKPAKFAAGTSVMVNFGRVYGIKKTRIRGYIRSVKGRFLDTPRLAEYRYEIILDTEFCGSLICQVREEQVTKARDGERRTHG